MRKQTAHWKTKDGDKVRICDMSDSHLANAMRLLERFAKRKYNATLDMYLLCPGPRGDAAQDAFDSELDSLLESDWQDFLPEIYEKMERDLARRESLAEH